MAAVAIRPIDVVALPSLEAAKLLPVCSITEVPSPPPSSDIEPTTEPTSPVVAAPPAEETVGNNAPGIPDRRKSLRPTDRPVKDRLARQKSKTRTSSTRSSMAKEEADDLKTHDEVPEDLFEDAPDTQRAAVPNHESTPTNDQEGDATRKEVQNGAPRGLGGLIKKANEEDNSNETTESKPIQNGHTPSEPILSEPVLSEPTEGEPVTSENITTTGGGHTEAAPLEQAEPTSIELVEPAPIELVEHTETERFEPAKTELPMSESTNNETMESAPPVDNVATESLATDDQPSDVTVNDHPAPPSSSDTDSTIPSTSNGTSDRSENADTHKRASFKPRPLSQRFMSPPYAHSRQRSSSPGRFPVRVDGSSDSRSASPAARPSSTRSLSGDLPPANPPPPSITETATHLADGSAAHDHGASSPQQPGAFARKASSGFGALLGRMGSIRRSALSPPGGRSLERTNTASTVASVETSSGAPLTPIADDLEDGDDVKLKQSLQDRFRTLREEEELHTDRIPDDIKGQSNVSDADSVAPSSPVKEHVESRTRRASSAAATLKSPPLDPHLPPGTASGMSAGPSKEHTPVNWDLWQSVVYEGPAAVARTSGEELSKAIASGIPAAIRGVVWQVLADSKSEELEALYKTLKARGAESESKPPLSRTDTDISQSAPSESRSGRSSRSSTHSTASSTQAASPAIAPPAASVDNTAAELQHKLLAEKQKRESAALTKLEKAIKRDLGSRTSFSKYTSSPGLQDGLFGVCKAYALFDTNVGYAQGINFIAMPLLFNMPEEEAFTLLVRMMHHYQLRTLFEPEMIGLHLRLYQFERLLEDHEPALFCHLKRRHVSPQLYATQWFLTLFAYRFPLQLVLRVYDLLFSEGLPAILKFGIVLMQRNKDTLLEMRDMSQLTTFLKEKLFDVYIDKSPSASSLLDSGFFGSVTGGADKELYRADELVRDASRVKVTDDMLQAYEVEFEENRRIERERDTELENLRTANTTLTSQLKNLEERAEQHDTEHVNLASDLVKYKVENDQLHDAKEGLELQVLELQKMVDTQPAEVEEKLKAEMDRIMQRNLEVQNENRHLQDELADAEQQLVTISMTHAETQSDFDSLKQKWSSLQSMLNKQ